MEEQMNRGTDEQRNRGTEEQGNRGAKEQGNRGAKGTEELKKNTNKQNIKGSANFGTLLKFDLLYFFFGS